MVTTRHVSTAPANVSSVDVTASPAARRQLTKLRIDGSPALLSGPALPNEPDAITTPRPPSPPRRYTYRGARYELMGNEPAEWLAESGARRGRPPRSKRDPSAGECPRELPRTQLREKAPPAKYVRSVVSSDPICSTATMETQTDPTSAVRNALCQLAAANSTLFSLRRRHGALLTATPAVTSRPPLPSSLPPRPFSLPTISSPLPTHDKVGHRPRWSLPVDGRSMAEATVHRDKFQGESRSARRRRVRRELRMLRTWDPVPETGE